MPAGVVQMFELDWRPSAIVEAGGAIWAEDHAATNRFYVVDPATGATITTIDARRPCDLVVGFGRVWLVDLERGSLVSVDPVTRAVLQEVKGLNGPCGPQAVDGAIWLAVDEGLARVEPSTGEVSTITLGGAAFPGAGTPLWAQLYGAGQIVRVDTRATTAAPPVTVPGGTTEDVTVAGAFGSLWVGNGSANRLYRLNPDSGAVEAEIQV
ncbi:MAG TPA: hypothetical protein VF855_05550, partial [Acidimicrobiales bacterium]